MTDGDLKPDSLLLIIRIREPEDSSADALYERTRKWWRTTLTQAGRAARVLAVVDGTVAEVYEPSHWLVAPPGDTEGRVGFVGAVSFDRERWVGEVVRHLFKPGAANPVRYLPLSAVPGNLVAEPAEPEPDLALLLRLNQSWYEGIPDDELYEATRAWWVLSPTRAERVTRVLAVAGGRVREAYEPLEWLPSPVPGHENRIGFNGRLAPDRRAYVDRDVEGWFRRGSANPVRYLPRELLLDDDDEPVPEASSPAVVHSALAPADEPGLVERILPLLEGFEGDLLWAQSRASQELFHSNTLAWLMGRHPAALLPLLDLFGASSYECIEQVAVLREKRNLDIVMNLEGLVPKVVIENKLYSVPYPAQLRKYISYPLPWSDAHGESGAADTRYVLLSLMTPTFPLPQPWVHIAYSEVATSLDLVEPDELGSSADLFIRYRTLVHRLVALAEAVDPAQTLDEQFSAEEALSNLPTSGFSGAVARMRFTGLAQLLQARSKTPKAFVVGGDRGGIISYWRRVGETRGIGWQFQDSQLRYQVTVEDGHLQGASGRPGRESVVQAEYLAFFDHADVEKVLGAELKPEIQAGKWLGFNPDFVYRHRGITKTVSTAKLVEALTVMTERVDAFADKIAFKSE